MRRGTLFAALVIGVNRQAGLTSLDTLTPVTALESTQPESTSSKPDYSPEQLDRIWSFAMHLDGQYIERGNFFLLGESMLVVAYAGVLTAGPTVAPTANLPWIARAIAAFGFLLAAVWMYVQARNNGYLRSVIELTLKTFPEYRDIRSYRAKRDIPTLSVMAYVIPGFAAIMWITLVAISFDVPLPAI